MPKVEITNFSDNIIKHQIVPLVMKDLAEPFIYTSLACSLTFSRACLLLSKCKSCGLFMILLFIF